MSSLPKILFLTFQFFSCCTLVAAQSAYWLANIQRRGVIPYGNDTSYPVFRNVKQSYGGIPGAVGKLPLSTWRSLVTDMYVQVME
jgi:hypothetical protein